MNPIISQDDCIAHDDDNNNIHDVMNDIVKLNDEKKCNNNNNNDDNNNIQNDSNSHIDNDNNNDSIMILLHHRLHIIDQSLINLSDHGPQYHEQQHYSSTSLYNNNDNNNIQLRKEFWIQLQQKHQHVKKKKDEEKHQDEPDCHDDHIKVSFKKEEHHDIDHTNNNNSIHGTSSGDNNTNDCNWMNTNMTQDVIKFYSPIGLEIQFQDLHRLLRSCLFDWNNSHNITNEDNNDTTMKYNNSNKMTRTNASAFLQGTRGSGKTYVLNQCLLCLHDEYRFIILPQQQQKQQQEQMKRQQQQQETGETNHIDQLSSLSSCIRPPFRIVSIHGFMIPGYSVQTVVKQILKQLSDIAYQESNHNNNSSSYYENLLRLKQTSFTNQLQLLNEILQLAHVDNIPILFIIDEIDTLLGTIDTSSTTSNNDHSSSTTTTWNNNYMSYERTDNERQLLLYHILERVATSGTLCSLIGITSTMNLLGRFEKRIKSRIEGTTKFIHFHSYYNTYQELTNILIHKFQSNYNTSTTTSSIDTMKKSSNNDLMIEISKLLSEDEYDILRKQPNSLLSLSQQQQKQIYESLQRDYKLGKDIRWYTRVFYIAISMYRFNIISKVSTTIKSDDNDKSVVLEELLSFQPHYLLDAIIDMGGSTKWESVNNPFHCYSTENHYSHSSNTTTTTTATNHPTSSKSHKKNIQRIIDANPRMRLLQDLSGPQVAFLFSCRRILARDNMKEEHQSVIGNNNTNVKTANRIDSIMMIAPLTFDRAYNEYRTSYKGMTSRYQYRIIRKAFYDLMNYGIIRPASDHTGLGPYHYHLDNGIYINADENVTFQKMPIQLTLDIHHEIKVAIDYNIIHCTTALREWGKRII